LDKKDHDIPKKYILKEYQNVNTSILISIDLVSVYENNVSMFILIFTMKNVLLSEIKAEVSYVLSEILSESQTNCLL
jgi:hypothetical protein